jgi:hypothetical protein
MTNTLHRYGKAPDFKDDYILFAMCTRGKNDEGGAARLRRFLEICARHNPVNMGDSKLGGLHRPSRTLTPFVHWRRTDHGSYQQVIEGIDAPTTAAAVFDNLPALGRCLEEVKAADLGLSINIAALTDDARECSLETGIRPHAVEYSFGFLGNTNKLPEENTLALMTMCGHGMISSTYAQKMIDWVKTGRKTPEACARSMSRFCVCGIFNPVRAERLLCRMANLPPAPEPG